MNPMRNDPKAQQSKSAPTRNAMSSRLPGVSVAAVVVAGAILALTGGLFTVSSLALFTSQESLTPNTFSTGSVDLTAAPAPTLLTLSNMVPGDEITAPLTITNSGTLEFRYSATSQTDEDVLASALELTIRENVTTCDNTDWDTDGTDIYGPAQVLGGTTPVLLFGDAATGNDPGDRVLAASANEVLCFHVELPSSTGNGIQGLSTTATFTFDAEQTANN